MGETRADPQLPGHISRGRILGRNAFGVNGNPKALGLLVIQHSVFVPIIRIAGQRNQRAVPR